MKKRFIPASIAAATALLLVAGTTAYSQEGPTTEQIENAKTAADHNAIADAYDAQAKALANRAATHKRMTDIYRNPPYQKLAGTSVSAHCKRLASTYDEASKDASQLAASHREMAAQAK